MRLTAIALERVSLFIRENPAGQLKQNPAGQLKRCHPERSEGFALNLTSHIRHPWQAWNVRRLAETSQLWPT
jgi:hypothetical protein